MFHLFSRHPATVGESYWQHLGSATSFGVRMIAGGIACLAHGLFPFVFAKTGSGIVARLHDRMILNRHNQASRPPGAEAGR